MRNSISDDQALGTHCVRMFAGTWLDCQNKLAGGNYLGLLCANSLQNSQYPHQSWAAAV